MKIEVIIVDKKTAKFKPFIVKKSAKLCGLIRKNGVVEVYLVAGNRMRALNKKFRGKNKDTNVLSFVTPEDFIGGPLGEVYLNPIFIKKNRQDLDLMLVHGVLHILGYDHIKKSDKIKMEAKEDELLSLISNI